MLLEMLRQTLSESITTGIGTTAMGHYSRGKRLGPTLKTA